MSLAIPFAAVIPGLLLLLYFNARQDYHLSPDVVWNCVLLGAAVSILAIGMELPLDYLVHLIPVPFQQAAARAFLGTAFPEELCKFLVVFLIAIRHEDYERPVDALVLSVAVALGFATFENLLYLLKSDDWTRTALARAMTAVPSHVINAMLMGYFLGLAQLYRRHAKPFIILALAVPTLHHGAYDLPLFLIDALNQTYLQPNHPEVLSMVIIFALIISIGSLCALACWLDLLHRDEADQRNGNAHFLLRPLPARMQRIEAQFWLLIGGSLAAASLTLGLMGFIDPVRGTPGWAQFYPQYFMLASSILPCVFGAAMFLHGITLWRRRRA